MAVYSFKKQAFTFIYFIGTVFGVILLLAAASGPSAYQSVYTVIGLLILVGGGFNFVYQVRFKYASYLGFSIWKRGNPAHPDASTSDYDIQIIRTHKPYDPVLFGALETMAQARTIKAVREGKLHAELIEYEGNNESGRQVLISRWPFNESYNFAKNPDGTPPSVPVGYYVRRIAGLAGITGIYMGMEKRSSLAPFDYTDSALGKLGLALKHGWLNFVGGSEEGEIIPWFFVDDCDARGFEVQQLAYMGHAPLTVAPKAAQLNQLGAFVTYYDGLPYIVERDTVKQERDLALNKLGVLEERGIDLDLIKQNKPGGLPSVNWSNPLVILALLGVLGLVAYFVGYALVGPTAAAHAVGTTTTTSTSVP